MSIEDAWSSRATAWARRFPEHGVGVRIGFVGAVPCGHINDDLIRYEVLGLNVPGVGNCLYHAVWVAAELAGIRQPFNLGGSQSVYHLRVSVALTVKKLLDEGRIEDSFRDGSIRVADLVATPNQFLQYSGQVPLLAMAYMLQRDIVTLCADGIFVVTPCIVAGNGIDPEPIVIYHCATGQLNARVELAKRDHYIAVTFRNAEERRRFADMIAQRNQLPPASASSVRRESKPAAQTTNQIPSFNSGSCLKIKRKRDEHNGDSPATHTIKRRLASNSRSKKEQGGNNCGASAAALNTLVDKAMELRSLDEHELDILRHNYTKHPKLALLYFHCCSLDPDTYVANDENLNGPGSDDVVNRLKLSLDEPVGIDNIRRCQEKVSRSCLDNGDVWACASCCEILNSVEDNIKFEEIGSLHQNFRLTAKEVHELGDIPETVIAQHLQVYRTEDGFWYYLNPDLVPDTHHVVLCALCAADPKKVPFSIASGHDYGRSGDLPDLNDVAAKCISPVRSFGLSIVASGKHSIGHSICFPSTGPSACSKVLPCSDMDCVPKVTFIGPREEWRVKKESYRNLYDLPVDSMYSWLSVLMNTHAFFKSAGIVVDTSEGAKEALRTLESTIHNLVDTVCSVEATTIDEAVVSERFGAEYADGNPADPVLTKSAVLKTVDGLDSSITNAAVEAMIDMIQPLEPQTIPIQRGADPFAEWSENGEMIAGAFPCLFIRGGKMLPHGTWPPTFIRHLMLYYDGRFEKNTMLVATLFNQLQRHTVVQQAARIGTSKAAVLEKLGNLANSKQFKLALINAKLDPSSSQAKRLNGYLLRILSLMGTSVPFSPFERAATRPKLAAVRARFGIAQHWVTVAPPEHHNLELHRIAMIRQRRSWNQSDELYRSKACRFEDLPYSIRSNARGMLNVSNTYPALAARVFDRCVRRIHDDIVLCKDTSNTRLSIDYGQRQAGAYGTVAAHAGVIEPQLDGRLHIHMNLYGSKYSPELLSRVVCSPPLRDRAAEWLNSVCCTKLDRDIHEWREKNLQCDRSLPKAFEIRLPETVTDVVSFEKAAQKRAATTNFHSHSSTCYKGKRGKYMCRLARPSGVNLHPTCPLLVTRDRSGDMKAGVPPIVHGFPVPQHLLRSIDCGYSVEKGEAFRPHGEGPLVWELQRPASDAYMVETNLILAALTCSHTNSSVINGVDCGDMIDEYQQAYMTKDDVALKSAASALHSALEHNVKFPSHADNSQTPLRIGQYLATRTVNSFSGGHEWSHSLMVHAITGHRSFLSSDKFWYIFPYSLMQYVNDLLSRPNSQRANACTVIPSKDVEEQLEDLADLVSADDEIGSKSSRGARCGTRSFTANGKVIFLSQAESYQHRGDHFSDFSPLEFECIVDVQPKKQTDLNKNTNRGRPTRKGFPFASSHPLFQTHRGYLRAKAMTPVFGGPPHPIWKNLPSGSCCDKKHDILAQYLLCTFTAWSINGPTWSLDTTGLLSLLKQWDRASSSLIDRQRCRYIRNVMKKGYRNARNEQIATDWRNRNVDYWKSTPQTPTVKFPSGVADLEYEGSLSKETDIYRLLCRAAAGSSTRRSSIASIKQTFASVLSLGVLASDIDTDVLRNHGSNHSVYSIPPNASALASVAASIQSYDGQHPTANHDNTGGGLHGISEPASFPGGDPIFVAPCQLSTEQYAAVYSMLSGVGKPDSLALIHGGGGTGKSFMVRILCDELNRRHYQVVVTCPTGAGACQLRSGRTFHSTFKCGGKKGKPLSKKAAAFLKNLFDPSVVLIVVDEISMLNAVFLVLLDERLRELYDCSKPFGGRSILLTGDFWQLSVVKGVSLCKVMYMETSDPVLHKAKYLFSMFRVFKLEQQLRAAECKTQQALLQKFRALPSQYPFGNRWSKIDTRFRPIDSETMDIMTKPLTNDDVATDPGWIRDSTILVTSNLDRCVLNACMAKALATHYNELLYRWHKPLNSDVPNYLQELIYNEEEHPELFGYFFRGAPGQILDNGNGNIGLGVANGTRCWFHSLGWDNTEMLAEVIRLSEKALRQDDAIVNLPFPPEFINVRLADRDGNPLSKTRADWPTALNLNHATDAASDVLASDDVIIPVGYMASNGDHFSIRLQGDGESASDEIKYSQHAVDLAMALTVWKSQGGTFNKVILLLEGSTRAPAWQFEHLYVAVSRVRSTDSLRCFPTSSMFRPEKLLSLRPNVFTIKWFMDIGTDGYWKSRAV